MDEHCCGRVREERRFKADSGDECLVLGCSSEAACGLVAVSRRRRVAPGRENWVELVRVDTPAACTGALRPVRVGLQVQLQVHPLVGCCCFQGNKLSVLVAR